MEKCVLVVQTSHKTHPMGVKTEDCTGIWVKSGSGGEKSGKEGEKKHGNYPMVADLEFFSFFSFSFSFYHI